LTTQRRFDYAEITMPKRTLALIVGLILLTIILLFAATRIDQTPQQKPSPQPSVSPQPTLTPTPPAYTTLEISPNPVTLPSNGKGSVQVLIDTNQNVVNGVQLEVSYDPKAITNVIMTEGTFFQNPQVIWSTVDSKNGRISQAQVLQPSQSGIKGKGVVATITFSKVPGTLMSQTQLQFLPKTKTSQSGIDASVLKTSAGTTIYLGTPSANTVPLTQTVPTQ